MDPQIQLDWNICWYFLLPQIRTLPSKRCRPYKVNTIDESQIKIRWLHHGEGWILFGAFCAKFEDLLTGFILLDLRLSKLNQTQLENCGGFFVFVFIFLHIPGNSHSRICLNIFKDSQLESLQNCSTKCYRVFTI